jgi:dihydropteridine reductase
MFSRALSTQARPARALVVGSEGALGRACVESLERAGWSVLCADVAESASIRLPREGAWSAQYGAIKAALQAQGGGVDAVICTAGGWAGGDASGGAATIDAAEAMARVSFAPALVSTCIAREFLSPSRGLLVLVGSAAALEPMPGALGYGAAKAATHFLVESVREGVGSGGAAGGARAVGVLPVTIDTPSNRKAMPKADHSSWTPASEIADRITQWADALRSGKPADDTPASGSLLVPSTQHGRTSWGLVDRPTFRGPGVLRTTSRA